jgi:TetR/AcrR family transcriptional regulator, fatty acid metabolism regulator protein
MVYRKTKATEERKEARRKKLLDSATKLFGKHGYHGTTVPMIVAEAESSTGSFYIYFRNKEDVFVAALEELGQKIDRKLCEAKETQPDVFKRMSESIEALFMFLAQNPEKARILIVESSGLSPIMDKRRRAILTRQEDQVRLTLEAEPEFFSVDNSVITARCMVGAVYEALYCWLEENPGNRMPAAQVARAVAKFNIQAVRNPAKKSQ